jgi:Leucine-rich repeat (LRR) protein
MSSNTQYSVKISADDSIIQLEAIEQVVEEWDNGENITGEIGFPTNVLTQITDPVFLAYCLSKMPEWDTNHDDMLSDAEAAAVTYINVDGTYDGIGGLTSLEGIEYFIGLRDLYCRYNQLTSLDMSKNTALTYLDCSYNQLTSLNVSKNTALIWLYCGENQLTSLDMSKNTALTSLSCDDNQLTSLDVRKNTELVQLWCRRNQLTSLDVSKNTALTSLLCGYNQLTSLDVTKNTDLTLLWCFSNQLTSLDISTNAKLTNFNCWGNPGDGISTFPVKAWFDANSIPSGDGCDFTLDRWNFNSVIITPEYEKAL